MGDVADLTVEILKQIRDGMFETKAELTTLRNEVTYRLDQTNERLDQTNERLGSLADELKGEMGELRRTVLRAARVNDETLAVSLEDSGRMDALEGRVRSLEAQMQTLHERK